MNAPEMTPVRIGGVSLVGLFVVSVILCASGVGHTRFEHTVTIDAPPGEVFSYFEHMNHERYLAWHSEHNEFHFVKGDEIEEGAVGYFDETVGEERHAMKVRYTEVVEGERIVFVPESRLTRLFYPRTTMTFEDIEGGTRYKQSSRIRLPLAWIPDDENALEHGQRHVREEGENLKRLIEKGEVPP